MIAAGLPVPASQHHVRVGDRNFYIDLAYPARLVGIEADGYRFHGTLTSWEGDEDRRTLLMLAGWRLLHVTWKQLSEKPDMVVARIRAALGYGQLWDERLG